MIWAVFKVMALRLLRDRGALVLAFALPGFIFAIFAAIFSSASGGNLDIRVAMAVTSEAPSAIGFGQTVEAQGDFSVSFNANWTAEDIAERVRLGTEDTGLIIQGDLNNLASPPLLIITEPSREIAASVLAGQVRQIIANQISGDGEPAIDPLIETRSAFEGGQNTGLKDGSVAYYVGATAILFLLFSAMQGAALSLEERGTGITQRLLLGTKGAAAMMLGKFSFLTLQGTLQAFVILGVAAIAFKVPILSHIPALILASLSASAAAASIALLVAALSKSSVQMHTASTFIVLLFSAVGGSMVPRFMMPDWLQSIGQFTPNAWAIEAFYSVLARGSDASQIAMPLAILIAITLICLSITAWVSHRFMRF